MRYMLIAYCTVILGILILGCTSTYNKSASGEKIIVPLQEVENMKLTSQAFQEGRPIPSKYTCDGSDISPPLMMSDVPPDSESYVLIMDDPDAPVGTWDHWIVFNIPANINTIPEGTEPEGVPGKNSWGRTGYGGPCPPSGVHRYFFKLYALDATLNLPEKSAKKDVERAMQGHILAEAKLMGTYTRSHN